jgi:high-affinity iron transporter
VFPTVETLLAQAIAAVFVIGSYFVAQEVRVKRPRRNAKVAPTAASAEPTGDDLAAAVDEAPPVRTPSG